MSGKNDIAISQTVQFEPNGKRSFASREKSVGERDGLKRVSVLMGTPANKDMLLQAGLFSPEIAEAAPADLMILVEGEQTAITAALAGR